MMKKSGIIHRKSNFKNHAENMAAVMKWVMNYSGLNKHVTSQYVYRGGNGNSRLKKVKAKRSSLRSALTFFILLIGWRL
jgi:hypothetical protein